MLILLLRIIYKCCNRNHNGDCRFDGFINLLLLNRNIYCARGRLRLYYINNFGYRQFTRIRIREFIQRDIHSRR